MSKFLKPCLELIALGATIAGVGAVLLNYSSLPDVIAVHFGISGQPDGFGSKAWLAVASVLSIAIYIGLSIACRYPHLSNTPWKITEHNRERQYRLIQWLLRWIKTENALLWAYLQWCMVQTGTGAGQGLNPYVMLTWGCALFLTVGAYFYLGYRAR